TIGVGYLPADDVVWIDRVPQAITSANSRLAGFGPSSVVRYMPHAGTAGVGHGTFVTIGELGGAGPSRVQVDSMQLICNGVKSKIVGANPCVVSADPATDTLTFALGHGLSPADLICFLMVPNDGD